MKAAVTSSGVRPAAHAGRFYPAAPRALARLVEQHLSGAATGGLPDPKAILAPHAGYSYSGPVAGSAFAPWTPVASPIRRVVLLGPSHWIDFEGLALPGVTAMATPLGEVKLDLEAINTLADLPAVLTFPDAHTPEHSLEVELPFLQTILPDFRLVPLVVGRTTDAAVAEVIDRLWGGPETRFVLSSDLSHYLGYADAKATDRGTADAIERGDFAAVTSHHACGHRPVRGFLLAASRHGGRARTVDLRNSGDTAGPRDKVVGYGAFHFTTHPSETPAA